MSCLSHLKITPKAAFLRFFPNKDSRQTFTAVMHVYGSFLQSQKMLCSQEKKTFLSMKLSFEEKC